jgi:hypothetical protein
MKKQIGIIFIVILLVIICFCGCNEKESTINEMESTIPAENPKIHVKPENGKIKITLTVGGKNMPDNGYSFYNDVTIRVNGSEMTKTDLNVSNWTIGSSIYIGGSTPRLDDSSSETTALGPGTYLITVVIDRIVIYDDEIMIIEN